MRCEQGYVILRVYIKTIVFWMAEASKILWSTYFRFIDVNFTLIRDYLKRVWHIKSQESAKFFVTFYLIVYKLGQYTFCKKQHTRDALERVSGKKNEGSKNFIKPLNSRICGPVIASYKIPPGTFKPS